MSSNSSWVRPSASLAGHRAGQRGHAGYRLGERARQAIGARSRDQRWNDLADPFRSRRDVDALEIGAAPDELSFVSARLLQEHRQSATDAAALKSRCCLASSSCNAASRSDFTASGTWSSAEAAGVPGRGEYLKENAWAKPISSTRSSVARKSCSLSPGMADDQIRGKGEIGAGRAQALDNSSIVVRGVTPVHRGKHAVGPALHRKMQKRHQLRHLAMGRDQLIIDVPRMRGGVADPIETGQFGEPPYQFAQPPLSAVGTLP